MKEIHTKKTSNKIVLAQIDITAGDIEGNSSKIINRIERAKSEKADLIIFPELALFGYPFGDIFMRHKNLIKKQLAALDNIVECCNSITALVGFVEPTNEQNKKPFYNSVAIIQNGKIIDIARKVLLPSYCEFNDNRYFESSDKNVCFELNGEKFGILICEDSWNDADFFEKTLYDKDPVARLMKKKPDTLINCSSSPSRTNKEQLKHKLFSSIAKKYGVNYIYVNQCGYGDNLSFDGASRIYDKNGNLTLQAKFFEEDFIAAQNHKGIINPASAGIDTEKELTFTLDYESDLDRTYKSLINGIKGYFKKTGFSKAVLGLSGGLDSSVCAVLLADALGAENVWGISMPTKITSKESKNDAKKLAQNLGINFLEVPIARCVETVKNELETVFENIKTPKFDCSTTLENLQARTRATILWSVANEFKNMLVIATSDKSELYIGYATINGDMSGGFAPIADVVKTKLFALARYLKRIPASVLEKPPGAELKINPETGLCVTAEEDNMPYEFLDEVIWLVENKNYGKEELLAHNFKFKTDDAQKSLWIDKFYRKMSAAIYKWHLMPPTVVIDSKSISAVEYRHPIISNVKC